MCVCVCVYARTYVRACEINKMKIEDKTLLLVTRLFVKKTKTKINHELRL